MKGDVTKAVGNLQLRIQFHKETGFFLCNIELLCPPIATFVRYCYNVPERLFILGGKELLSQEGTTQGDPTATEVFEIA